jgi:hypothetical protein
MRAKQPIAKKLTVPADKGGLTDFLHQRHRLTELLLPSKISQSFSRENSLEPR